MSNGSDGVADGVSIEPLIGQVKIPARTAQPQAVDRAETCWEPLPPPAPHGEFVDISGAESKDTFVEKETTDDE